MRMPPLQLMTRALRGSVPILSPSMTTNVGWLILSPSKTRRLTRSDLGFLGDMCDPGGIFGPRMLLMVSIMSAEAAGSEVCD